MPAESKQRLPFISITGPNILPPDIFILSTEHKEKNNILPKVVHVPSRNEFKSNNNNNNNNQQNNNNNHLNNNGIQDVFERYKNSALYDVDSINQTQRDREISKDEFETLLHELEDIYISPHKELSDQKLREYIYKLWNIEELRYNGILELKDIEKGYEKNLSQIFKVYLLFLKHQMVGKEEDETINNQNIFNRVLKSIYYMNNILISEYHLRSTVEENNFMAQEELNIFQFTPQDNSGNKSIHNVVLFVLNKGYQEGYRLYNGCCYKQIYTEKGYPTHAWVYVKPLFEFINQCARKETNSKIWKDLLDSKDIVKRVEDHIINAKEKELPELKPDRHLFSCTDGIYDAKAMLFYEYENDSISSDRVAIKYFNYPFDLNNIKKYNDWYDIPIPELQGIMDHQKLDKETCKIIYAMMGRCLYEVGEMDTWEVILFIKGMAGTGKSTIGKIIKDFYPTSEVFMLSSNIEKKFGLGAIYNKLLFLCLEVKANWGLDQGDFQCMISGEEISVPIKHKTATSTMWKVPGMLMGNEIGLSWLDAAGSMTRRVPVVQFDHMVKQADTSLSRRLKEKMPTIIHKCNMAYRELVELCGTASVWDKLPPYFKETRKKLAQDTSPLEEFVTSCPLVQENPSDPNCCIPLEDFKLLFLEYAKKHGHKIQRFTEDSYKAVFENHGFIVMFEREKEYRGKTIKNMKWVVGISLREDDDMVETQPPK